MKVLLADDDPEVLLLLETMMAARGWTVVTATSGVEAIALLDDHEFDAAMLDQQMLPKQGTDVAEEARRRGSTMPIIVCTGWRGTIGHADAGLLDVVVADKTELSAMVRLLGDLLETRSAGQEPAASTRPNAEASEGADAADRSAGAPSTSE